LNGGFAQMARQKPGSDLQGDPQELRRRIGGVRGKVQDSAAIDARNSKIGVGFLSARCLNNRVLLLGNSRSLSPRWKWRLAPLNRLDPASTSQRKAIFSKKIMRSLNVIRNCLVIASVCLTLLSSCRKAPEPQFDLIIRNGNVAMALAGFGFLPMLLLKVTRLSK